jgi:hypothetical protein
LRDLIAAFLDFGGGPGVLLADEFIQSERAFIETALNGLFLVEGPVAVRGVVTRECDVAEAVEPYSLNLLPIGAKYRAPLRPHILVLR